MFSAVSLKDQPVKEGRLPIAIPSPRAFSPRQVQKSRQTAVLAALSVMLLWSLYLLFSHSAAPLTTKGLGSPANASPTTSVAPTGTAAVSQDFPKLDVESGQVGDSTAQAVFDQQKNSGQQVPLSGGSGGSSSSSDLARKVSKSKAAAEIKFATRPGFEDALDKVVNMLPSELETRGLLRPIELTGERRLRELGKLARKYKRYHDAWEDLHVVTDSEGGTHVRDDVIQYLRHKHFTMTTMKTTTTNSGDGDDYDETTPMSLTEKIHAYEEFRGLLVQLNDLLFPFTAPYFSDHMTFRSHLKKGGRGIVLTAGNDQVAYLLTQIPILRQLGCNLPIEVMYNGDNDLNRDSRQDLEDLDGVTTRDIASMLHATGWDVASWAAKPFAVLLSSFREVIFIDADSFFFVNPEVMFDYPEYVKTGALFFRDRLIMPENKKNWLQSILPQPVSKNVKQSRLWTGESGHQQESGVMVVDTYRHFMAMMFVCRMNGPDRDGNAALGKIGVYDMVYGDKETFWLGFELIGDTDYVFHQGDAGIIGQLEEPPNKAVRQLDPADDPEVQARKAEWHRIRVEFGDPDEHWNDTDPDPFPVSVPPPDSPQAPKPKICSPQLLHLDTNGKPLWFNGGLVRNKFLDRREWRFGAWDTYLIEPRDVREPGAWFLGEANMCCLTTDQHLQSELSPREKDLLDDMVAQARKVGIASNWV